MAHAWPTPGCVGQNVAGAVMMVEQIVLTTLLLGWLFARFARQDERRQALLDSPPSAASSCRRSARRAPPGQARTSA